MIGLSRSSYKILPWPAPEGVFLQHLLSPHLMSLAAKLYAAASPAVPHTEELSHTGSKRHERPGREKKKKEHICSEKQFLCPNPLQKTSYFRARRVHQTDLERLFPGSLARGKDWKLPYKFWGRLQDQTPPYRHSHLWVSHIKQALSLGWNSQVPEVLILTEAPLNPNSRAISEGNKMTQSVFITTHFRHWSTPLYANAVIFGDGEGGNLDTFIHLYPVETMIHSYLASQHGPEEWFIHSDSVMMTFDWNKPLE